MVRSNYKMSSTKTVVTMENNTSSNATALLVNTTVQIKTCLPASLERFLHKDSIESDYYLDICTYLRSMQCVMRVN